MNPKVSVIIPAYNAEKTLKRCLDSVFAQDFDFYEVILVNDGSTDGTLEVARVYEKYSNFVLVNQPNGGAARARWAGVRYSQGGYISFVDVDDYVSKNFISKMYGKAEKQKADIVVCNYFRVIDKEILPLILYETDVESNNPQENIITIIIKNDNGSLWNKLWRREILKEEVFEKTFDITYGEDLLLLFNVLLYVQIVAYESTPLYFNVVNHFSVSRNPTLNLIEDCLNVFDEMGKVISSGILPEANQYFGFFYATKLLQRYKQLCQIQSNEQKRDVLKNSILEKLRAIPIQQLIRPRPGPIFILKIILIKLRLFSISRSLWIGIRNVRKGTKKQS